MKLNCKRIDFTYTPGEEIFNFPEESGLPFIFDVEEELTGDPAAMDAVGEILDEAEKLAEKAKAAIKAALADEDSCYHNVVTFFMEFHRDDVGPPFDQPQSRKQPRRARTDDQDVYKRQHQLTVDIERRLKERFGPNTLISIHVEPIETEKLSSSDSEKDKNI